MALLANIGWQLRPFENLGSFIQAPDLPSSDNVVYYKPGEPAYDELRQGFNKRIDKHPLVIAQCRNTAGVAEAMRYALGAGLAVTVKSGGHCMEGFSCNNGGMVINVSQLNSIKWLDSNTIKVGPGCILSKLYDELIPKGKIIPGGSCGTVGIGGLVLGGGYGILGRQLGLTCDSLKEVTMVDGNSVIRSSASDSELLWACKGGGNGNFGVVTELTFNVHKAPASMQSYRFKSFKADTATIRRILERWFEQTAQLPDYCFSAFVLNRNTVYILLTSLEKSNTGIGGFIKNMSAITQKTTHTKAQALATALKVFYGQPHPTYFKNASAGLYNNFAGIAPFINEVIDTIIKTPGMIYQVNTLGGNIQRPELEPTAAFPHRSYPYFSELQTYWETATQPKRLLAKFQEVQDIFARNNIRAQYRNYPDINFANWETLYYGSNYGRLQQVKNKYDPHNLFSSEQSIRNT